MPFDVALGDRRCSRSWPAAAVGQINGKIAGDMDAGTIISNAEYWMNEWHRDGLNWRTFLTFPTFVLIMRCARGQYDIHSLFPSQHNDNVDLKPNIGWWYDIHRFVCCIETIHQNIVTKRMTNVNCAEQSMPNSSVEKWTNYVRYCSSAKRIADETRVTSIKRVPESTNQSCHRIKFTRINMVRAYQLKSSVDSFEDCCDW